MPGEIYSVRAELTPLVEELVASLCSPFTHIDFLRVLVDGGVLEPVPVDAAVAARMVRPYAWLLDRVGMEGIRLTAAGWLPRRRGGARGRARHRRGFPAGLGSLGRVAVEPG